MNNSFQRRDDVTQALSQFDVVEQFKTAMFEDDIPPPDVIIPDGAPHRFKIDGKLNGFYRLHTDGRAAGCYQDWKQHDKPILWKLQGYTQRLTEAERRDFAEQRRSDEVKRQVEEVAKHEQAASKARYVWQNAKPSIEHPYLTLKKINPHRTRINQHGALIIPILNANFELVNLQFINVDGSKRFLTGGQKKSCFWWIGKPTERLLIAEGFATAASINEHTGEQTFIAFDAGNLESVAKVVRRRNPKAEIIIMADHDLSGVGQSKARCAALAIGGKYLVCPEPGQDFNDYFTSGGLK